MKKIGYLMMMLCFVMPMALWAQDPTIKVSVNQQVSVGEQFTISFETNFDVKKFSPPSFQGFTFTGGPFTSTSSSIQIINGVTTHTVKNTFTYALRADQEGTFTIGSVSMTVDGKVVKSDPVEIKVVAGSTPSNSGSKGGQPSNQPAKGTTDPAVNGKDLFLKAIPSKKTAYVGEPLVLSYKLYTRIQAEPTRFSKLPSYNGFWTKDFSDNTLHQSLEMVNGVEYATVVVQKIVLIPQKAGKLSIDPMVLDCEALVMVQDDSWDFDGFFNDPFFSRRPVRVQKSVECQALTIDVKSLPANGKPVGYEGAVGDYKFTATVDQTEVKANEDALTFTVSVSGSGNLELVKLPEPVFPPDFEVYDPKITSSVDASSQGMSGTKKAEYLVIPRRAGDFTVPPVEFSYFNPAKEQYVTLSSSEMNIKVTKGADDDGGLFTSAQEDIKHLGSDIRHIDTNHLGLKAMNAHFFASPLYFIILAALLLLFIIIMIIMNKRRRFKKDVALVRNRQATKVARGRLKNARKYLKINDQNHFYEEMSQALWGYISDKLGIERSVLSMDMVKEAMVGKGMNEELSNQFVDTLNTCEFARFAPGDAASKMEGLYEKGLDVIMKVEKSI